MQVSYYLYEDVPTPLGVTLYLGLNLTFFIDLCIFKLYSKLLKNNELHKISKNYFVAQDVKYQSVILTT